METETGWTRDRLIEMDAPSIADSSFNNKRPSLLACFLCDFVSATQYEPQSRVASLHDDAKKRSSISLATRGQASVLSK